MKSEMYRCARCGEEWREGYDGDRPADTVRHDDDPRSSCPGTGLRITYTAYQHEGKP